MRDLSQMDLNDESSDEEDVPVVAAPAAHPQQPAAEPAHAPAPQPAAQPEEAMQQAHLPKEVATGVEKPEELVAAAAAEAVMVKEEVEGTRDAAAAGEAIKKEATRPGTADGKRKACGTPGCPFPDQHAGACPSLRAEGKRKRRLPAALRAAAMGVGMEADEGYAVDSGRKRQRVNGHAHG